MQVKIKDWGINPEILSKGMELEIRTSDGNTQKGDLYITCTGIIWCRGRTTKKNGIKLDWDELISKCENK